MRKIPSKDVQAFVAGALALDGFHSLLRLPGLLASSHAFAFSITAVATGLALPLGIAILAGSAIALRAAEIYLWLATVAGSIALSVAAFVGLQMLQLPFYRGLSLSLFVPVVLLALLLWSRLRRLPDETSI